MQNFSAIHPAVRWTFQKNSWGICSNPPPFHWRGLINTCSVSVNTVHKARRVLAYRFLTSAMRDVDKDTLVALHCSYAFCFNFGGTTWFNVYGNPANVYEDESIQISNAK